MPSIDERSLDKQSWSDVAFVKAALADDSITAVDFAAWGGGGGLSGDSCVLTVKRGDAEEKLFVKLTVPDRAGSSKIFGLAREGVVLRAAAAHERLSGVFPKVHFAYGDMNSGRKVVALECVDGVQAGYFFGAQSLHNWGKDLPALTADFGDKVSETAVTLACFRTAAALHAAYWGKPTSSGIPELRCRNWLMPAEGAEPDQENWAAVVKQAVDGWAEWKAKAAKEDSGVTLAPELVAVVDASFAKTTWAAYTEAMAALPLTLAHGDFHPSNIVMRKPAQPFASEAEAAEQLKVLLVDWEVVGVGSGPQDLGQFHISHSSPEARRRDMEPALRAYVEKLAACGVEGVGYDHVLSEYQQGGLGRWVWLLGCIGGMPIPAPALNFFASQAGAFVTDHGFTAENAPIVRA